MARWQPRKPAWLSHAEWLKRRTSNPRVGGSNPPGRIPFVVTNSPESPANPEFSPKTRIDHAAPGRAGLDPLRRVSTGSAGSRQGLLSSRESAGATRWSWSSFERLCAQSGSAYGWSAVAELNEDLWQSSGILVFMTTPDPPAPYLLTFEVAQLLRCSIRTVHELTRRRSIPHRKLPGSRRCLFVESELRQWLDGADLDVVELPDDGRVVRVTARD